MKQFGIMASSLLLVIAALVVWMSVYVIDPTEQVILTQFGKPVGKPVQKEGLHFKLPFVQEVNVLDRRVLEWDGVSTPMQTKDKLFIQVDTYGRWQIVDPLQFFLRLRDERSAESRLDDILAGETLKAIARHELVEVVRSSNREPDEGLEISTELKAIEIGRNKIEEQIRAQADKELEDLGIKLLDLRFKRVNYKDQNVIMEIHRRMASEREQIAEQIRSEGDEEASLILGKMDRELKEIESDGYKRVQEIQGRADAQATQIYADAFNQSEDAVNFYEFTRTMEVYKQIIGKDTTVILSTDSDLFQYFKGVNPSLRKDISSGNVSEELPLFLRDQ
tara:strand:- start:17755 stop:18759 length:1005 start_codon:yes stop_codon:yes gene_type:complete